MKMDEKRPCTPTQSLEQSLIEMISMRGGKKNKPGKSTLEERDKIREVVDANTLNYTDGNGGNC